MASAEEERQTERRTMKDVISDLCAFCLVNPELKPDKLLMLTTSFGHEECLEVALSFDADNAAWDRDRSRQYEPGHRPSDWCHPFGRLLVEVAAKEGQYQCLQMLINEGFQIFHQHEQPIFPISFAAKNGHTECFDLLWKAHKERDCLSSAIWNVVFTGCTRSMKMMIAAAAFDLKQELNNYVDYEDDDVTPFLSTSVSWETLALMMWKNVPMIELLIAAGADLNQKNDEGETALTHHVKYGNEKCVNALIKAGADVNATNDQLETPLRFSVKGNALGIVMVLLRNATKINILNQSGVNLLTSLLMCEKPEKEEDQNKHKEKVMILFAAGEMINTQAMEGVGKKVPEYLQPELSLKDICRRMVRQLLLDVDPHTSLFGRVYSLEIPNELHGYLLYEQTLDKNDNAGDEDDDDDDSSDDDHYDYDDDI